MMDGGDKVKMKRMAYVGNVRVCALKVMTVKTGFDAKKCPKWANTVCANFSIHGPLCETGVRNNRHLSTATTATKNFIMKYYK